MNLTIFILSEGGKEYEEEQMEEAIVLSAFVVYVADAFVGS